MVHVNSYFEVDWKATADNLRQMLQGKVSPAILADAMYVTERTVYNWLNETTCPGINELIFLAKFIGVDLLYVLVINGPQSYTLTRGDVREMLEQAYDKREDMKKQKEYTCVEEVYGEMVFNEFVKQNNTIRSLNDFLLYLPLVDLHDLCDVLYRIRDNIGRNPNYVFQQLERLYKNISNSLAKEYADQYRTFFSRILVCMIK